MTMTFSEPTGSPDTLLAGEGDTEAPALPAPANVRGAEGPVSEAARLLLAAPSDRRAFAARLLWGLAGLTALGAGPQLALEIASVAPPGGRGLWGTMGSAFALPTAAALTITLPLPGLLILLEMQDDRPDPRACLHAFSLGYFRMGLMAVGLAPVLMLYALTGARDGVLVVAGLGYFVAGGVALSLLLKDVHRCLPKARATSRLLLLGWACFVCLLAVYFFFKLEPFGR